MNKPLRKIAVVAGAAVASFALASAPAMADPSTQWTVSPEGPFHAVNVGNVVLSVNGLAMTCTYADAAGNMQSASGNPAEVATINSATFGKTGAPCTSLLGSVVTVAHTPWKVMATDYDASTGVTTGYIDNVSATVTVGACVFDVAGKASGTYTNGNANLAVNSKSGELTVTSATNCGTAIKVGDLPTFTGTYHVTSDSGGSPTIVGSNPPS